MALAHVIANKAEAAYRRGDLFEKRRKLMEAWTDYCSTVQSNAENVTPIRANISQRNDRKWVDSGTSAFMSELAKNRPRGRDARRGSCR